MMLLLEWVQDVHVFIDIGKRGCSKIWSKARRNGLQYLAIVSNEMQI